MSTQQDASRSADPSPEAGGGVGEGVLARLAEIERVCWIGPDFPRPEPFIDPKELEQLNASILARLAEVERVCGIRPDDTEPDRRLSIPWLADRVHVLQIKLAEVKTELRKHGHQFDKYVSDADPTRRLP